jgi:zinc protease
MTLPQPIRSLSNAAAALLLSLVFLTLPAMLSVHAAVTIQRVKSDAGVEAWLVEDYTVPIISIRFAFEGGSTQDPAGKEGLANLMSGLFDEGAGDLDSDAFQIRVDDAGAEMRFDAGRDHFYGSTRMLAEQKDEALELLRLAIQEPRFDQGPVDRIRGQILAGIVAEARDPNTAAQLAWAKALYDEHPYGRRDEGTPESLASITPADLKSLHERVFARGKLKVGVVGAIDAETLKAALDRLFGGLPQEPQLTPVADIEPELGQRLAIDYELPQTSLTLAYPGMDRKDPQFFAAYLMNQVLGGGTFSSRLFEEVREKRGLAYNVGSSLVNNEHSNGLIISTATRADRAAETLDIIRAEVKRMAEDGPAAEELEAAKLYVVGAYAINNLNSSSAIASTLVELQVDDLGIDYINRRAGMINAVTLDEAKAAAKRLLSAEPAVMVVGPEISNGG